MSGSRSPKTQCVLSVRLGAPSASTRVNTAQCAKMISFSVITVVFKSARLATSSWTRRHELASLSVKFVPTVNVTTSLGSASSI